MRSLVAMALMAGALLAAPAGAARAQAPPPDAGVRLTATLTGAAEVPGPGDPDGRGRATLTLNPGQRTVCFALTVSGVTLPATGAHIHIGSPTEAGPVVVGLTPPDAAGASSGCVTADRALIRAIIRNPEGYYVNVHTTDFPGGAVRGQLERPRGGA